MNARGYCLGCYRSREERFHWNAFSDSQKRAILRLCRQRYLRLRRGEIATPDEHVLTVQPSLFDPE